MVFRFREFMLIWHVDVFMVFKPLSLSAVTEVHCEYAAYVSLPAECAGTSTHHWPLTTALLSNGAAQGVGTGPARDISLKRGLLIFMVSLGPADPAPAGPIICEKQEFLCSHHISLENEYTVVNWFSGNRISKFRATRCQILRLKCTEFDFRLNSAPDPVGELTALPRLHIFKGPTSKGEKGKGREEKVGKERWRDLPD